jgi:hypothetical protein
LQRSNSVNFHTGYMVHGGRIQRLEPVWSSVHSSISTIINVADLFRKGNKHCRDASPETLLPSLARFLRGLDDILEIFRDAFVITGALLVSRIKALKSCFEVIFDLGAGSSACALTRKATVNRDVTHVLVWSSVTSVEILRVT